MHITVDTGTIKLMEEEPNSNVLIAIIVLSITVVIAAGIIITICFLNSVDKNSMDNQRRRNNVRALSDNMYSRNLNHSDLNDGGFQACWTVVICLWITLIRKPVIKKRRRKSASIWKKPGWLVFRILFKMTPDYITQKMATYVYLPML